jgi:hypothetical protein
MCPPQQNRISAAYMSKEGIVKRKLGIWNQNLTPY